MTRYVHQTRVNRYTKTAVSILDTQHPDNSMDPAGGRWATVCETHGNVCNHKTLALARVHAAYPEWCSVCLEEMLIKGSKLIRENMG